MTTKEFKTIARLLKQAYKELEIEAVKEGVDLLSPEYQEMMSVVRETLLSNHGFTLEEYRTAKAEVEGISSVGVYEEVKKLKSKTKEIDDKHIPSEKEIIDIAEDVAERIAKKYIKEPVIINKIVKEIEQPKIIKETIKELDKKVLEELDKDLFQLQTLALDTKDKLDKLKIPEEIDLEELEKNILEKVNHDFDVSFKKNIDIMGMPDFRKLAMGLEGRISNLESNGVGGGGGTWGSITGTLSNQTDLQSALDAKLDGNGTATYVPFYSDANTLTSDAHFYYNSTTDILHVHGISGDGTDGLLIESENGTDVGILGAANTANVTWYGNHNFSTATQDTIAGFTGAGKTLGSLSTATYPSLTELSYVKGVTSAIQTQINTKANSSGALTQFVGNTAWRVWYSDGSGDVQELALGADGTFLKSNGASVAPSFAVPSGSGNVSKVGTPVNNQIGVWTGDGTIEGDVDLVYDSTVKRLTIGSNTTGAGDDAVLRIVDNDGTIRLLLDSDNATDSYWNGILGIGTTSLTRSAYLELGAGSTTVAPLIIKAGTNLTTPVNGAIENNGTHLYYTAGGVRYQLDQQGGGSGITRTVVVTSGSITLGSAALTDYIYFVAGAHTLSMPAASGNTNRYTIKNNHSAAITVDTAGAENIEGAASISIDPEDSVDVASDGTNWWII